MMEGEDEDVRLQESCSLPISLVRSWGHTIVLLRRRRYTLVLLSPEAVMVT